MQSKLLRNRSEHSKPIAVVNAHVTDGRIKVINIKQILLVDSASQLLAVMGSGCALVAPNAI